MTFILDAIFSKDIFLFFIFEVSAMTNSNKSALSTRSSSSFSGHLLTILGGGRVSTLSLFYPILSIYGDKIGMKIGEEENLLLLISRWMIVDGELSQWQFVFLFRQLITIVVQISQCGFERLIIRKPINFIPLFFVVVVVLLLRNLLLPLLLIRIRCLKIPAHKKD